LRSVVTECLDFCFYMEYENCDDWCQAKRKSGIVNNLHSQCEDNIHLNIMNGLIENQDELEVIDRLDERMNIEHAIVDGEMKAIIHNDYASGHLYMIEKFIKDIETGWKGGFIEEASRYGGVKRYREKYLDQRYYRLMNGWIWRYSDLYRYSTRVEVFYDVCREMNLLDHLDKRPFHFGDPNETDMYCGIRYMDWFSALIEQIQVRCQSREFKERERLRMINAKRNEENVLAMEEEMFSEECKSRWLVLSLTLKYKPKYRRWITPKTIKIQRDKLFSSRRSNKLTAGIKNYVCRIEQGEDTGLHLHVVLFYLAESNRDESIAKLIGEYWENEVTEGKGEYWSSNDGWLKKRYEKRGHGIGVGQINWNDHEKRKSLRMNLIYLAKAEQYLMIKTGEDMRTFTMGYVPKKEKPGRPRGATL